GDYTITLTDSKGCTFTATYTLTQPVQALGGSAFVHHVKWSGENDGFIAFSGTGGTYPYTYDWTGPNGFSSSGPQQNNLVAGDYRLKLSGVERCTFTATYTITQPAQALGGSAFVNNVKCFGVNDGFIAFSGTGGT